MNKPLFEHGEQAGDDAIDPAHEIAVLSPQSSVVNKELNQIYALLAVAERQQHLAETRNFQSVVLSLLALVTFSLFFLQMFAMGNRVLERITVLALGLVLGIGVAWAMSKATELRKRAKKHHQAAAEVAETLREVISGTDWKQALDPLEWAHLRTRIAQLELVDLAALQ